MTPSTTTSTHQKLTPLGATLSVSTLKPMARVSPLKAKQMAGNPLQINTYSTVFENSESLSIVKKSFIPESATLKEKAVHNFLTRMCVY